MRRLEKRYLLDHERSDHRLLVALISGVTMAPLLLIPGFWKSLIVFEIASFVAGAVFSELLMGASKVIP